MSKFDERVWYKEFVCPSCGYKSIVTNICRECLKTPADSPITRPSFCIFHKQYHEVDGEPTTHRSIVMKLTGWATRYNPNLGRQERRKVKNLPKDAILR